MFARGTAAPAAVCSMPAVELFAEEFGDKEDDDGTAKASSEEEIDHGIADGGNDWGECGDHHSFSAPLVSESTIMRTMGESYGVFAPWGTGMSCSETQ